jgi:mannose-1-phosphate guanylyltransferase
MYAVILAGGSGTRLWPRSRQSHPKQFADITGSGRTMIQATVDRLGTLVPSSNIFVVTGDAYTKLTTAQLPDIPANQILGEPSGRNTAPAIGLACIHLRQRDPSGVLAILPADHVIPQQQQFQTALQRAADAACAGYLVTLGIQPTFAHTGYGYIKRGRLVRDLAISTDSAEHDLPIYTVERFLEKPDRSSAEEFLRHGGYYWNGGIFVSRVDVMLAEIERQMPDLYAALLEIERAIGTAAADSTLAAIWPHIRSISIDYGVMEGAQRVAMTPLEAGWNDVGSWDALESVLERDADDNYIAHGNALAVDSWGNIVFSEKAIVALVGVDDLVVVEDGNALLIGHKHQMQKVKNVVEQLRQRKRDDLI